jgi:hypothetical protein
MCTCWPYGMYCDYEKDSIDLLLIYIYASYAHEMDNNIIYMFFHRYLIHSHMLTSDNELPRDCN